jgi:ribose 5-phosphate isomerase B
MTIANEQEIREIVQRVVAQTMGGLKQSSSQKISNPEQIQKITPPVSVSKSVTAPVKSIAIGSDHGGFEMKEKLKKYLSVDYPDFAHAVAKLVSTKQAWRGIMIDGAGIGSCMTANKVPGVRAAMCYDYATAVNSREHNDANMLTLGAGLIGQNQAILIIETWLKTEFSGGRHTRRVEKIGEVEKLYLKGGN